MVSTNFKSEFQKIKSEFQKNKRFKRYVIWLLVALISFGLQFLGFGILSFVQKFESHLIIKFIFLFLLPFVSFIISSLVFFFSYFKNYVSKQREELKKEIPEMIREMQIAYRKSNIDNEEFQNYKRLCLDLNQLATPKGELIIVEIINLDNIIKAFENLIAKINKSVGSQEDPEQVMKLRQKKEGEIFDRIRKTEVLKKIIDIECIKEWLRKLIDFSKREIEEMKNSLKEIFIPLMRHDILEISTIEEYLKTDKAKRENFSNLTKTLYEKNSQDFFGIFFEEGHYKDFLKKLTDFINNKIENVRTQRVQTV
ncbi:hypothetical protein [Candidatus Phytoplasma solani]|uniref:Uncharacterized protein n=1 Tax=Candidatus Phytoplasma solani TaxID=69896 RepID=A0A421NY44_9MOLU|nr:hypothetical protein [Candidatus Phytoplasma solani]RMI88943.1 hypothetical protein PSSA1_v1c1480 [Candidatus Phytoplasma solani]